MLLRSPAPPGVVLPRAFDSDSVPEILRFTENVDCPRCGEIFEGEFLDHTQSLSVQDMQEPPRGAQVCPECGHGFSAELTGWMFYGEAG
jgi:ribosomal protein S27AE